MRTHFDNLPDEIKIGFQKLVAAKATIDEIVLYLESKDYSISRSAVGRYSKNFKDVAQNMREMVDFTKAIGADVSLQDTLTQSKATLQMLQALINKCTAKAITNDELPSMAELQRLSKSVSDLVITIDKVETIETRVKQEIAEKFDTVASEKGLSKDLANEILKAMGIQNAR